MKRLGIIRSCCLGGSIAFFAAVAGAATEPTGFEQYQLELLNRARANPTAEVSRLSSMTWGDTGNPQTPSLNEGVPANMTITTDAKQPLAFNVNIEQAARDYAQQLVAQSKFTHNLGNPPNFTPDNPANTQATRMIAAGYSFSPNPSGSAENLAATGGSNSGSISAPITMQHHNNLFIDNNEPGRGHRTNMMDPNLREVGIGMAQGMTTIFGASTPTVVSVQDFGFTAGNPFLTGVVYRDTDTDSFYSPGEGLGGVTVTATPLIAGAPSITTTYGSGGYSLQLPNGQYHVTIAGTNAVADLGNVTVSSMNVKLDAINPAPEPASLGLLAGVIAPGLLWRRRRRSLIVSA